LREPAIQLELEEVRLSPGQEWSPDAGRWRLISLQSGTAYWLEAHKPKELAPNELLIVSPPPVGLIRASQLSEVVLHWFAFQPSSLLGFFSVVERNWIEECAAAVVGPVGVLPSTHPISRNMRALIDSRHADGPLVERARVLVLVLGALTQSMPFPNGFPNAVPRRGAAARERFNQIISRMPDTELIQHSSEELARLCGCTLRHFNRLFRLRFGEPPRVRQTELRLLKACQLLKDSSAPVSQIAAECGFRSWRLFNSLFRRRYGIRPSEWRHHVPS
jgi:AraC-like DNA-binding protein